VELDSYPDPPLTPASRACPDPSVYDPTMAAVSVPVAASRGELRPTGRPARSPVEVVKLVVGIVLTVIGGLVTLGGLVSTFGAGAAAGSPAHSSVTVAATITVWILCLGCLGSGIYLLVRSRL
jgi:hypothetical protein